jgi:ribosome-associated toxin RatA of RatAB toxin-antitoxin module
MGLLTSLKVSSVQLPCEPGLPYEILTDYDAYSEWFPLVASSKLLAKEGDLAIAELEIKPPGKNKFVMECIHDKNRLVLTRVISGWHPVSQFEWRLEKTDANNCLITLAIEGERSWRRLARTYKQLMKPESCLAALQTQISAFAPEISSTTESEEKIFEIFDTGQGLFCWIQGKKYALTPVPENKHD